MGETIYSLLDRLLEGTLDDRLREWRSEGLSLNGITKRLHREHDIDVSTDTVRRWLMEIDRQAKAAS